MQSLFLLLGYGKFSFHISVLLHWSLSCWGCPAVSSIFDWFGCFTFSGETSREPSIMLPLCIYPVVWSKTRHVYKFCFAQGQTYIHNTFLWCVICQMSVALIGWKPVLLLTGLYLLIQTLQILYKAYHDNYTSKYRINQLSPFGFRCWICFSAHFNSVTLPFSYK